MVKARIECSLNEADFNNYAMSNLFAAWPSGRGLQILYPSSNPGVA